MKQYPTAFRERALAALDRGVPRIQVARLLHVDPSTLSRWRREQARTGSVAPRRRTGRPPRISATDLPALRALVAAHPDATITEYQVLWAERTGQHVSGRALRRALGRAAITRKKRP